MGCEIDYDNRVSGIISLYSYNVAYVLSIESNVHVVLEEHERHGDRIAFGQPANKVIKSNGLFVNFLWMFIKAPFTRLRARTH